MRIAIEGFEKIYEFRTGKRIRDTDIFYTDNIFFLVEIITVQFLQPRGRHEERYRCRKIAIRLRRVKFKK